MKPLTKPQLALIATHLDGEWFESPSQRAMTMKMFYALAERGLLDQDLKAERPRWRVAPWVLQLLELGPRTPVTPAAEPAPPAAGVGDTPCPECGATGRVKSVTGGARTATQTCPVCWGETKI